MTYVGAIPTTGDFKKLDSITTSSTTTFNLRQGGVAVYPQSANHCLVVLNGVLQTAGSSFNIVNDTIVFASSLSSSDVINQILVLGNVNDIGVPSDDTVSTAKIQSLAVSQAKIAGDAINADKIADDSISEEHLDVTAITGHPEKTSLVDADKFLISDSAASGALKYVQNSNLGGSPMVKLASGSASSSVNHYITGYMDSSKYNCYFITLSKIIGLQGNAFNFYFAKTSSTSTTSDHWHANYGWRSNGSAWNSQGEAATEIGFGSHLDAGANTVGSAYFYQYQNPATTAYGNSVDGRMWGYRADYGDYVSTFFSAGYNGTDAVVGFRLKAGGADATTFDYAIYGLEK